MTVQGTVNKTGILLLCVVATAAWTWGLAHSEQPEAAFPWMLGAARAEIQKLKRRRALALRGAARAVPENNPAKFKTFTRSVRLFAST